MAEVFVARAEQLKDGNRVIVESGGQQIGVIRAGGQVHAFLNVCPHQGGPVCDGMVVHRVEEVIADDKTYQGMRFSDTDIHLVCPWHGWEFNIATGRCAGDGKLGLRRFKTVERDGGIYVLA